MNLLTQSSRHLVAGVGLKNGWLSLSHQFFMSFILSITTLAFIKMIRTVGSQFLTKDSLIFRNQKKKISVILNMGGSREHIYLKKTNMISLYILDNQGTQAFTSGELKEFLKIFQMKVRLSMDTITLRNIIFIIK